MISIDAHVYMRYLALRFFTQSFSPLEQHSFGQICFLIRNKKFAFYASNESKDDDAQHERGHSMYLYRLSNAKRINKFQSRTVPGRRKT